MAAGGWEAVGVSGMVGDWEAESTAAAAQGSAICHAVAALAGSEAAPRPAMVINQLLQRLERWRKTLILVGFRPLGLNCHESEGSACWYSEAVERHGIDRRSLLEKYLAAFAL